jgi:hypothetical protein
VRSRRRIIIPLALSLALGAFAVPAFADGPAAGCGQGFSLGTLEEVWGSFEEIVQGQVARDDLVPYDLNDDLYMCFRQFKSNGGQDKQKSKLFGEDISGYNIVLFIDNKAVGQMK